MNKHFLLLFFIVAFPIILFSQSTDSTKLDNQQSNYQTLFSNHDAPKVSGFGSFNFQLLALDSKLSGGIGFDGAVLINRSFYMGFYGRGNFGSPTYTLLSIDSTKNIDKSSVFFHSGVIVGANFMAEEPIHFGFSTKFGGGAYMLYNSYDYYYVNCSNNNCEYEDETYFTGPLFVITPMIDVEMNITNWMKFKVGFGYQWVSNSEISYNYLNSNNIIDSRSFNTGDLSSPIGEISFIFGWFK
ncbi:MAG: hypothetical protein KAG84_06375 [Bacteroidales bacterium]|nr:hypothetical protein [Bacteroidales bacterium]